MDDARALAGRPAKVAAILRDDERARVRATLPMGTDEATVDRIAAMGVTWEAADLIDRLAAPEGVRLTRYDLWIDTLAGEIKGDEKPDGEWVRHADAAAALATLKERINNLSFHHDQQTERAEVAEAERDALKAEAITALLDEWMEFCLGIGHTQPNAAAIERFNSKLIIRHLNKIIGAKITQPGSLDALRAAISKTQGGG